VALCQHRELVACARFIQGVGARSIAQPVVHDSGAHISRDKRVVDKVRDTLVHDRSGDCAITDNGVCCLHRE
jgi:hypothetical protein